jgi:hypothetical protein
VGSWYFIQSCHYWRYPVCGVAFHQEVLVEGGLMYGTRWFSFKHNAWAIVSDEKPMSAKGFYLISLDNGDYRRYNEERIRREVADQRNIDAALESAALADTHVQVARQAKSEFAVELFSAVVGGYTAKGYGVPTKNVSGAKSKGILIGLIFE